MQNLYLKRVSRGAVICALAVNVFCGQLSAYADSSSPRLAAYYDLYMAICEDRVYEWRDDDMPQQVATGALQVGVGKSMRYLLTHKGELAAWEDDPTQADRIMNDVISFHAGHSGLFVVREDHSLWHLKISGTWGFGEDIDKEPVLVTGDVLTASIGDSANYYVTNKGRLFVKGRAHRGQYGDGKLSSSSEFVHTASDVIQVSSHTGHALILKKNGEVWGTGGNIYGPLSHHGYGDKAISWGKIFEGASRIASGSSHSVAIRNDGSLWSWGRNLGLEPKLILEKVDAVATSSSSTIALSEGALWQWDRGKKPIRVMACE